MGCRYDRGTFGLEIGDGRAPIDVIVITSGRGCTKIVQSEHKAFAYQCCYDVIVRDMRVAIGGEVVRVRDNVA